jgi:hypothetical protein
MNLSSGVVEEPTWHGVILAQFYTRYCTERNPLTVADSLESDYDI